MIKFRFLSTNGKCFLFEQQVWPMLRPVYKVRIVKEEGRLVKFRCWLHGIDCDFPWCYSGIILIIKQTYCYSYSYINLKSWNVINYLSLKDLAFGFDFFVLVDALYIPHIRINYQHVRHALLVCLSAPNLLNKFRNYIKKTYNIFCSKWKIHQMESKHMRFPISKHLQNQAPRRRGWVVITVVENS